MKMDSMPKASKGASSMMDGMNPDGKSKNTFAPDPKSTPNKVQVVDEGKKGKGDLLGGVQDEAIFSGIDYTTLVEDFGKKDKNTVDKSVFNTIGYNVPIEAMDRGAMAKDKKVNGDVENTKAKYIAPSNSKK